MRGISLDEIATATKIGTRSLKALEDENFAILPGGIFNKGFVRAYAKFLGLNEEEAVADYQAAVKEAPVSVKTIAAQSAIAKANRLAAQQARESSSSTAGIVRALILLVIAAGRRGGEHIGVVRQRDGLVQRKVYPVVPPRVEYSLSRLGRTLIEPLRELCRWSEKHLAELQANRARAKAKGEAIEA